MGNLENKNKADTNVRIMINNKGFNRVVKVQSITLYILQLPLFKTQFKFSVKCYYHSFYTFFLILIGFGKKM